MSLTQHVSLVASLVSSVLGRQPIVAVPTPFIHLLGDCTAATFLAQCCYLSDQSTDPEGWFERSHEAWRSDLNLSPEQIRRCVRHCAGMIEVKRMGLPSRNFYRILPEGIRGRLATLQTPEVVGLSMQASVTQAVSSQSESRKAVAGQMQPPVVQQTPQQAAEQTRRHSSIAVKKEKDTQRDDVQRTSPVTTEMLTRLLTGIPTDVICRKPVE
ncbi:hypothetical protein [Deinococcus sp.]|uniref:hypothetical protein n=1 Tax=Deinococcus sp. TaxID=47478 RepID=UPI0025BF94C3|nr:hypothetical protein [Deinococcus sp.]